MIEWLNANIAYWHWIVLGLVLAGMEIFMPTFFILWFGAAAVSVGLVLWVVPMTLTAQLLLWIVNSAVFVVLWHKLVSPRMKDRSLAGMSREAIIGQTGIVVQHNSESGRGRLKFPAPILGDDEWDFICEGKLAGGDRVTVTEVSGNSLIVRPKA